jgi:hypothetical protein
MGGTREDAIFVVKLSNGHCSSSPMRPGECSPIGPIPSARSSTTHPVGSVRAKWRSWAVLLGTGAAESGSRSG